MNRSLSGLPTSMAVRDEAVIDQSRLFTVACRSVRIDYRPLEALGPVMRHDLDRIECRFRQWVQRSSAACSLQPENQTGDRCRMLPAAADILVIDRQRQHGIQIGEPLASRRDILLPPQYAAREAAPHDDRLQRLTRRQQRQVGTQARQGGQVSDAGRRRFLANCPSRRDSRDVGADRQARFPARYCPPARGSLPRRWCPTGRSGVAGRPAQERPPVWQAARAGPWPSESRQRAGRPQSHSRHHSIATRSQCRRTSPHAARSHPCPEFPASTPPGGEHPRQVPSTHRPCSCRPGSSCRKPAPPTRRIVSP